MSKLNRAAAKLVDACGSGAKAAEVVQRYDAEVRAGAHDREIGMFAAAKQNKSGKLK